MGWIVMAIGLAHGQTGTFAPNGVYPTTTRDLLPRQIHTWGSWIGGDAFEGRQESAWTPAASDRVVFIAGYPSNPGLSLEVEWRLADGTVATERYAGSPIGEAWVPWRVAAPPGAQAIRWVAEDRSQGLNGWLGVSEIVKPGWALNRAPVGVRVSVAFCAVGLVLALSLMGMPGGSHRDGADAKALALIPEALRPIVAAAAVATSAYVIMGIWFLSPQAGAWASSLFLLIAGGTGAWRLCRRRPGPSWLAPIGVAAAVGLLYLAMLFRLPEFTFHHAAATQILRNMPMDNELPGLFAKKLINHDGPKNFIGDWLTSDRPPLESGWVLLFYPVIRALHLDLDAAMCAAGCWFQLLWCPALWGLARSLGLSRGKALAVVGAVAPLGLLLANTVYVWPKLGAAAFVTGAVTLGFLGESAEDGPPRPRRFGAVGGLLALGWLSHGGAAFSVLGTLPLFLWRARSWRAWAPAALVFLLLVAPWIAYQRYYDPPGNRLLKWHLAGVVPIDNRSFGAALVDQYRKVGWQGAWTARESNLIRQFDGDWRHGLQFDRSAVRRSFEVTAYLRSAGFYFPAGILAWFVALLRRRTPRGLDRKRMLRCGVWVIASWLVWIALMFEPNSAIAHQGSYAIPLGLYALLVGGLVADWPILAAGVFAVQSVYFFAVWMPR